MCKINKPRKPDVRLVIEGFVIDDKFKGVFDIYGGGQNLANAMYNAMKETEGFADIVVRALERYTDDVRAQIKKDREDGIDKNLKNPKINPN